MRPEVEEARAHAARWGLETMPSDTAADLACRVMDLCEDRGLMDAAVVPDSDSDGGLAVYWFRGDRAGGGVMIGNDGSLIALRLPYEVLEVVEVATAERAAALIAGWLTPPAA